MYWAWPGADSQSVGGFRGYSYMGAAIGPPGIRQVAQEEVVQSKSESRWPTRSQAVYVQRRASHGQEAAGWKEVRGCENVTASLGASVFYPNVIMTRVSDIKFSPDRPACMLSSPIGRIVSSNGSCDAVKSWLSDVASDSARGRGGLGRGEASGSSSCASTGRKLPISRAIGAASRDSRRSSSTVQLGCSTRGGSGTARGSKERKMF
jgi:hypothetical protein